MAAEPLRLPPAPGRHGPVPEVVVTPAVTELHQPHGRAQVRTFLSQHHCSKTPPTPCPPLGPHETANQLPWQSPPVSTQPSSYWTSSTTVHQPMARHLHGPLMSGLPENLASASPPCGFCKENEPRNRPMFMSHPLRDPLGRTVCPLLRAFTCPTCGATGDHAHTRSYCPVTNQGRRGRSVTSALKNTIRMSDGRVRKRDSGT